MTTHVEMATYPHASIIPNDDTVRDESKQNPGIVGIYAQSFGVAQPTRQQKRYDYHKRHGKPILENLFDGKLLTGQYARSERCVFASCIILWLIGTAIFTYLQFINPEKIHESPMNYTDTVEINTRIVKDYTSVGSKASIIHYQNIDSKLEFSSPCDLNEYYVKDFKVWVFDTSINELDGCSVKITLTTSPTSSNLYHYNELGLQNQIITDHYKNSTPARNDHKDLVIASNIEKGFDGEVHVKETYKYYDKVKTSSDVLVIISPETNYYYSVSYKTAIGTSIAFTVGLLGIIQPIFNLAYDLFMFRCRKGVKMFKRLIYIVKKNPNGEKEESLVSA